jgi:Flp pilus assembly protein TadG
MSLRPTALKLRTTEPRPAPMPALPTDSRRLRERGQAMVEFAAVLLPLLLIIVGIIQFGLIFGANVTLTNAAREAARAATIEPYDINDTPLVNGLARCTAAITAARNSFGIMSAAPPNFTSTSPCPAGSAADLNGDGRQDRWINGDMTMTICSSMATPTAPCPTSGSYCTATDAAECLVQVRLTYRSNIIVPFIGDILSTDAGGRFVQTAVATMVIN